MLARRGFLFGLAAFAASAPAIVRAASIMPVKALVRPGEWERVTLHGFDMYGNPMSETLQVRMPRESIRQLLLRGLTGMRGSYTRWPQWEEIFDGPQASSCSTHSRPQ
jgi:hypothetical protein